MSFREIPGAKQHGTTRRVKRGTSLPKIRVTELPSSSSSSQRSRRMVLHGRVCRGDSAPDLHTQKSEETNDSSVLSIRNQLKRKSEFSQLASHAKHFGKLVADLEAVLKDAGDSPEAAWRAKILSKSAQDTSETLWNNLLEYEQRIHNDRTAQTACLKLHRDVKRIQKTYMMCVSQHQRQQQAEISMLGAVGWSSSSGAATSPDDDADIFDRTMREREIQRMNQSMHQVNDLYQELAGMVNEQQEKIDYVDEEIVTAKKHVEAGARNIHCAHDTATGMLCGATGGCGQDESNGFDRSISMSDDAPLPGNGCAHFSQVVQEAVKGFHNDLILVGKDIWGDSTVPPPVVSSSSSSSDWQKLA